MQRRPDQDLFDRHSAHFKLIDPALEAFCTHHGLRLDKNALRQPCRVIRIPGNPNYLLDIHEQDVWYSIEYNEQLPHSVLAVGHYSPPDENDMVYRVEHLIAHGQDFGSIRNDLEHYLDVWLALVSEWVPETIRERGKLLTNLTKKYMKAPWVPDPEY
jgi:hypothetical protein